MGGGGGEISNIIVSNATRPEWPRLRRIGSRAGSNGKFFRGAQARLKGPGIRAEKKILIIEPLQRVFRTILNDFFLLFLSFSLPTQYSFFCKQQSPPPAISFSIPSGKKIFVF